MDLPREAIEPEGYNCFSRGSILEFLRKHIVTCDFQGVRTPFATPPPLDPHMPCNIGKLDKIIIHHKIISDFSRNFFLNCQYILKSGDGACLFC